MAGLRGGHRGDPAGSSASAERSSSRTTTSPRKSSTASPTWSATAWRWRARRRRAKPRVIVMAGVHFMAETAKLLNPTKTVLIPDARAGCSLAESITPEDIALLRQAYPGRAGRHLCEHIGRGEGRLRHLLHLRQCAEGGRVAGRPAGHHDPGRIPRQECRRADEGRDRRVARALRGARAVHRRATSARCAKPIRAPWCSRIPNVRRKSSRSPTLRARPPR